MKYNSKKKIGDVRERHSFAHGETADNRDVWGGGGDETLKLSFHSILKKAIKCGYRAAETCCRDSMGVASCHATHHTFLLRASCAVSCTSPLLPLVHLCVTHGLSTPHKIPLERAPRLPVP